MENHNRDVPNTNVSFNAALGGELVILTGAFVGGCKSASENIRSMFLLGFPGGSSWEGRVFVRLQVWLG